MATTTNFGWTTPNDTDLLKDGAAAIRTLGSNIDASLVDLKGGTTGQVLAKASNTDLDYSWVAVDPLTILDAKGDLITATAADTPARLAVGANNTVLMADSTAATGLKWGTAGGADPYLNNITSGATLGVNLVTPGRGTNVDSVVARTCYTPIYLPSCTLDRLTVRTQSWSGNYTVRLGIYNNSNGKPSTVLLDAGTVSATAANTDYSVTINQAVSAGWYWLAANNQVQVTAGTKEFLSTRTTEIPGFFVGQGGPGFDRGAGFIQTGVTGAFATASPTLAGASEGLILTYVRIA